MKCSKFSVCKAPCVARWEVIALWMLRVPTLDFFFCHPLMVSGRTGVRWPRHFQSIDSGATGLVCLSAKLNISGLELVSVAAIAVSTDSWNYCTAERGHYFQMCGSAPLVCAEALATYLRALLEAYLVWHISISQYPQVTARYFPVYMHNKYMYM